MDELLDILDANGKPTGQTALKSVAHRNGLYHRTVHIWFYTEKGQLLFQQRGKKKDTYPLLWDVSVAGHIGAGEAIEAAAVREVAEEIGIQITIADLQKIGVFKSEQQHTTLTDNEFHHTFLCELKVPIEALRLQDSEVEAVLLKSVTAFSEEQLKNGKSELIYVPHDTNYYLEVVESVQRLIQS